MKKINNLIVNMQNFIAAIHAHGHTVIYVRDHEPISVSDKDKAIFDDLANE